MRPVKLRTVVRGYHPTKTGAQWWPGEVMPCPLEVLQVTRQLRSLKQLVCNPMTLSAMLRATHP